jgi:hypothetical protein
MAKISIIFRVYPRFSAENGKIMSFLPNKKSTPPKRGVGGDFPAGGGNLCRGYSSFFALLYSAVLIPIRLPINVQTIAETFATVSA